MLHSPWGLQCPPQGLAQRDQSSGDGQRNKIIIVYICHSSGGLASNFLSDSIPVTLWDLSQCVALRVREITRADSPVNAQAVPSRY